MSRPGRLQTGRSQRWRRRLPHLLGRAARGQHRVERLRRRLPTRSCQGFNWLPVRDSEWYRYGGQATGTFLLRMKEGADLDRVTPELVDASGGRVVVRSVQQLLDREISEVRENIMPALNGLMGLMAVLALVSLGGTLVKSVQERRREIAILKTVGYTPGQIVRSVVSGAGVVSALGAVIGAPLGWVFVRLMVEGPFTEQGYDTGDIVQIPGGIWIAAMFVGALIIAIAASAVPGWRAASMRIADAMRYE